MPRRPNQARSCHGHRARPVPPPRALGLSAPWEISDIRFDAEAKRIDFDVTFASGSRFACPACGAEEQPVHDTRQRTWKHLHFFEHQAYIHAAVPRVRCQECGKTSQVEVPWARPESGFTQLFEALVITLYQQMPVRQLDAYRGIGDDPVWRILAPYVGAARAQEDFSGIRAVGIDETAARRWAALHQRLLGPGDPAPAVRL